jgi:hemolysin activation/secretion protein
MMERMPAARAAGIRMCLDRMQSRGAEVLAANSHSRVQCLMLCLLAALPAAGRAAQEGQPQQQQQPPFDLFEIRVLGSSALDARDIERAVYPFLGEQKTLADVEAARDALAAAYRDHGYGTVAIDIPEQTVDRGIVRLQVTEGRLGHLRVSGARYVRSQAVRDGIPSVARGEVLNTQALQQDLAALNQKSADRVVVPVLKAGESPGSVDLELKVNDKLPFHGFAEVNDRYTSNTSRSRTNVSLGYDNLFQRFHSLSLQYQSAPEEPDEAQVFAATYVMPAGSGGSKLAFYAVDSDSDVATVGTLGVIGAGRIYGSRFIVPLRGTPEYFQSFAFGVDYKDFDEVIRLEPDLSDLTPIQYFNWSAAYSGNRVTDTQTTTFTAGSYFGIRGVGNDPAEFAYKRFRAPPNYFYLRANVLHDRAFFASSRLRLRLAGQYSAEPLISNEQFSMGGIDSVRGYLESEALVDQGISGSLEWLTPSFGGWLGSSVSDLRLLAFGDFAVGSLEDPLPGQRRRTDLSSAGVGLRLSAFDGLEGWLDWAYPLVPTSNVEVGDSRIHFMVRYAF